MIDLGPPPLVFPKPAIIRPASADLLRYGSDPVTAFLPGLFPAGAVTGRSAPPPSGGFVSGGYYGMTSGSSTMNFTGVNIGAASVTRTIIITAGARFAQATGSTCTVNGVTISRRVESTATSPAAIYSGIVAAGTTGVTVSLSGWSSTSGGAGIGVYALYDLDSPEPTNTNFQNGSDAALSITVLDGGFVVATARAGNSSSGFSWSNLSEDYDELTPSGSQSSLTGASDWFETGGSKTVTANYNGGTKTGLAMAAFR